MCTYAAKPSHLQPLSAHLGRMRPRQAHSHDAGVQTDPAKQEPVSTCGMRAPQSQGLLISSCRWRKACLQERGCLSRWDFLGSRCQGWGTWEVGGAPLAPREEFSNHYLCCKGEVYYHSCNYNYYQETFHKTNNQVVLKFWLK